MNVKKLTFAAIIAVAMASATGAPRGVAPLMGAKRVTADITEAADFSRGVTMKHRAVVRNGTVMMWQPRGLWAMRLFGW